MSESYEFEDVDTITTGAIGRPGERVFYLQVRGSGGVVSLKLEKQQVAALSDYLARLLEDLPAPTSKPHTSMMELREPIEPAWTVGAMAMGYESDDDRLVLFIEELVPTDEEGNPEPEALAERGSARVRLTRDQAAALAEHARDVVAAGRPMCRLCGRPMPVDEPHVCPRNNGHSVH